jgi:chromosome segregation protein
MTFIRRIEIKGFKTFGKKVSINFDKGLTVITGPNGSGKSNILDAIKFALGELSPKELRGGNLSDIIHKNSLNIPAKSAHVSIQFDNSDRRIPIDSDFVTISREFRMNGEGIYRINGKRVSRKQLTDLLSSADIQVTGFNLIPQHAITRLAEITSEERRKIIENMIGIAIYDAKKAEAQVQLQQADLNIKVASARIEEVKQRVETLEKERNEYLKYLFLKNEINRIKAHILSSKIKDLCNRINELESKKNESEGEIKKIKKRIDELSVKRSQLELERKKFEEEVVDKGNLRLFQIEREISNKNSEITRLKAEIEAKESNLKIFNQQKERLLLRIKDLNEKINQKTKELEVIRENKNELEKILNEKQNLLNVLLSEIEKIKAKNNGLLKDLNEKRLKYNSLLQSLEIQDKLIKEKLNTLNFLANLSLNLEVKNKDYKNSIEFLRNKLKKLFESRENEKQRIAFLKQKIHESMELMNSKRKNLAYALKTIKKAKNSLIKFKTQKKLIEKLDTEDSALKILEEIGRKGLLAGIFGSLQSLIKFDKKFSKAIKAASKGWLKSLVVKDIAIAIECLKILKESKVGRIKIIPLESFKASMTFENKSIKGLIGPIKDLVECDGRFKRIIDAIFGNAYIAINEEIIKKIKDRKVRIVTLSGDLYEPEGTIEGGFFKEIPDLSELTPSTGYIFELEESIKSLEKLIKKEKLELESIKNEIKTLKDEEILCENKLSKIEEEIDKVNYEYIKNKKLSNLLYKKLKALHKTLKNEKLTLFSLFIKKIKIEEEIDELRKEFEKLKEFDQSIQKEKEFKVSALIKEINSLNFKKSELENKLSLLESSIALLLESINELKFQYKNIENKEIESINSIKDLKSKLELMKNELNLLEIERDKILNDLISAKKNRSDFELELKCLSSELEKLFNEYTILNNQFNNLSTQLKEYEIQKMYLIKELHDCGYSNPLANYDRNISELESTLNILENELKSIGAVNQLAVQQYDEYKSNYKVLSSRIRELEVERMAIINFMNELDKKKLETFMKAFDKINKAFQEIFGKITDGGFGKLSLENPDDPFQGGLDILLSFPGKAELPIGNASGGEKSVATVCFILALQAIHPMPFYIFDEIDAHLDAVNSQRLADLLKERSKNSQFIVISLKDTTISRADKVYGVFIQDSVSQIVALPTIEVI